MDEKVYSYRIKSGNHYLNKQKYKLNDKIELTLEQASKIIFKLTPLDPESTPEYQEKIAVEAEPEHKLTIIGYEAADEWNVFNELTETNVNDAPLTFKQAEALAGKDAMVVKLHQEEDLSVDPEPMKVVHKGGGRWALVWEKSGEEVSSRRFKKDEALEIIEAIKNGDMVVDDIGAEAESRRNN